MYEGVYEFAQTAVKIRSLYENVHTLCAEYRSGREPQFTVQTDRGDILFEREKAKEEHPDVVFEDGVLETQAVYRKLAERLVSENVLLIHGSAVAADGKAYLFTAKSGTGKSTHTALWLQAFDDAFIVNDDKPLVRVENGKATVYGTPWDGKHHRSRNTAVPLAGICLLERGKENSVESVAAKDAFVPLLKQIYRPRQPEGVEKMLLLTGKLLADVPVGKLYCNQSLQAAAVSRRGLEKLRGKNK